jgi:hypothetical protein
MRVFLACVLAVTGPVCLALVRGQGPAASTPAVTITPGPRQARVIPNRRGFTHTGGGNIDVSQPAPDTLVVTMTGVAVAGGHPCKNSLASLQFDLVQGFEVSFDKPSIKEAKVTLEGRIIGLLRSHAKGGGSAQQGPAIATISAGPVAILALSLPSHRVAGGETLSVNDREGPVNVNIVAGKYNLRQSFTVSANHAHRLTPCKAASAEFAPDPALDPLWISYWEPFHGALKRDFGFQIVMKVAP